jgi:hypothetical protein
MLTPIVVAAAAEPSEMTWFGLDPSDVIALCAVLVAIGAFIVSWVSAAAARRSADAAKESAQAQAAALQLATAAAEREAAARLDAEGPSSRRVVLLIGERDYATVTLTMIGGPPRANQFIDLKPDAWCLGFVHGRQHWSHDHDFEGVAPHVPIEFDVGLMLDRPDAETAVAIALRAARTYSVDSTSKHLSMLMYITAIDATDASRRWEREVPALLTRWAPPSAGASRR